MKTTGQSGEYPHFSIVWPPSAFLKRLATPLESATQLLKVQINVNSCLQLFFFEWQYTRESSKLILQCVQVLVKFIECVHVTSSNSQIINQRATKGFILIRHKRYQIYTCSQLSSSIASFVLEFWSYGGAWQREDRVCRKIYTYLVIFSHFRRLNIRKSAFINIFGSVQIISRLDSQSKIQMFTLFTGGHVGRLKRSSNMAAPY